MYKTNHHNEGTHLQGESDFHHKYVLFIPPVSLKETFITSLTAPWILIIYLCLSTWSWGEYLGC